jgi:hypothetical protein
MIITVVCAALSGRAGPSPPVLPAGNPADANGMTAYEAACDADQRRGHALRRRGRGIPLGRQGLHWCPGLGVSPAAASAPALHPAVQLGRAPPAGDRTPWEVIVGVSTSGAGGSPTTSEGLCRQTGTPTASTAARESACSVHRRGAMPSRSLAEAHCTVASCLCPNPSAALVTAPSRVDGMFGGERLDGSNCDITGRTTGVPRSC